MKTTDYERKIQKTIRRMTSQRALIGLGFKKPIDSNELLRRLNHELTKFSYVPGTELEFTYGGAATYPFTLRVSLPVKQVSDPSIEIMVGQNVPVDPWAFFHENGHVNVGQLKSTLLSTLRSIELHELDEWFKYQGKSVHAPHFGHRRRYPIRDEDHD